MRIEVSLFGAFRDWEPAAIVALELAPGARVSDLRRALSAYALANWPGFNDGLLQRSAFASATTILRDHDSVPVGARMAVLPPVGGG